LSGHTHTSVCVTRHNHVAMTSGGVHVYKIAFNGAWHNTHSTRGNRAADSIQDCGSLPGTPVALDVQEKWNTGLMIVIVKKKVRARQAGNLSLALIDTHVKLQTGIFHFSSKIFTAGTCGCSGFDYIFFEEIIQTEFV
jgi:hypothetical protein